MEGACLVTERCCVKQVEAVQTLQASEMVIAFIIPNTKWGCATMRLLGLHRVLRQHVLSSGRSTVTRFQPFTCLQTTQGGQLGESVVLPLAQKHPQAQAGGYAPLANPSPLYALQWLVLAHSPPLMNASTINRLEILPVGLQHTKNHTAGWLPWLKKEMGPVGAQRAALPARRSCCTARLAALLTPWAARR